MATQSPITNYSAPSNLHRRRISVGLRYEAPPNRVHACLTAAALSVPEVKRDPAPRVLTRKFNDFSVDYDLLFFVDDIPRREDIESNVMTRIWYHLGREGLSIPFPIQDVNVRTVSADAEAKQRRQTILELEKTLGRIPEFSPLSDEDRSFLAAHAQTCRFAAGEQIIAEGEPGVSCYIIEEGEVVIETTTDHESLILATVGHDEYFGERSVITGEPTSASVRASIDCVLHEISKKHLAAVLMRNQSLVEALGQRLAEREAEGESARERSLNGHNAAARPSETAGFVSRIRNFFQI